MNRLPLHAARPLYAIGDQVEYTDHHNREQDGRVIAVVANWHGYNTNGVPDLTYTVSHPTYQRRSIYIGEDGIHAPPARAVEGGR